MLNQDTHKFKLIPADTRAERCFLVLVCLLWGNSLFSYLYVEMDILLHAGDFFRTSGKYIIFFMLAMGGIDYFKPYVKPKDFLFIIIFMLLYFCAPNAGNVPLVAYSEFTSRFIFALPFYFIGLSLNISKTKKLLWIVSVMAILVGSYYHLIFIRDASYTGEAEYGEDNMTESYSLLLPTIYVIWYTLMNFKINRLEGWISLVTSVLGIFSISVLGTRGPFVCMIMFIFFYVFFYKINNNKLLYGTILTVLLYLVWININTILLSMAAISEQLGFSSRVFDTFLSNESLMSQSSGRDEFYPILIQAMNDSPIWGYGIFGSFKFIHSYTHNIFIEILFSFGYVIGGFLIFLMGLITFKGFKNNLSEDQNNFLFVLIFEGVLSLFFSDIFIASPAFFLFLGYSVQMAYRKI